ncbi:MAG: hypothetical protein JXB62_03875 [Pirellulales bacterium]|nr:hypothetical protein [Pirellulales bacterium]
MQPPKAVLWVVLSLVPCIAAPAVLPAADSPPTDPPPIDPAPRAVLSETLQQWTFDRDAEGWVAESQCDVSSGEGLLKIRATGNDPFLHRPVDLPGGRVALILRVRGQAGGGGSVYWTTDRAPGRGEDKRADFSLLHDGQWHETTARLKAPGRLTDLRIDPGTEPGTVEIDWIRLLHEEPHPLTIERVEQRGAHARFHIRNHRTAPLTFSAAGQEYSIDGETTLEIDRPLDTTRPLEAVSLGLRSEGLPPVDRTVFLYHARAQTDWIVRPSTEPGADDRGADDRGDGVSLLVARDGSVARILRGGTPVALLAPLVHCDGKLPVMKLVDDGPTLRFQGQGVSLCVSVAGKEIGVSIDSEQPCEGPVVRALGRLQQGLLAGLEYLGQGERSSSTLDIETDEHVRFAPDTLKVTMPLMAFVTDRAAVAMAYDDMQLQPVYATPNFFDCTDDHRMALRGTQIAATICVDRVDLEETILWAVKRTGLPPLPKPPRSPQAQRDFCLAGLNGPLRTTDGWGHCAQEQWQRQPFVDMASTIWRLTGKAPELPRLVPGGAHVRNDTIYFVTGRARQWLDHRAAEVRGILRQQQPDGSFRYDGQYRRGHFENTASGVCARPAALLLEYAWATGDREALEAGVRTLEYMKRFRTPRGAQVWEVPLHTPDQLASAYLVWAYVRGYELTGSDQYLKLARKWALSGVPFTYLWQRYPIMLYSTPPVYGATFWRHSWFGLPVQWVGGVYAYALTMLAPYDDSLDWNHLAWGILLSGEQQQYPDGSHVGLLPDSFNLRHQRRQPADINPCGLMSLRLVLEGQLDCLSVAADGNHRVAAPFPVTLGEGKARIEGIAGVEYQVIVDGSRIIDVKSHGRDTVPLP